jgi:hypothetical protein
MCHQIPELGLGLEVDMGLWDYATAIIANVYQGQLAYLVIAF